MFFPTKHPIPRLWHSALQLWWRSVFYIPEKEQVAPSHIRWYREQSVSGPPTYTIWIIRAIEKGCVINQNRLTSILTGQGGIPIYSDLKCPTNTVGLFSKTLWVYYWPQFFTASELPSCWLNTRFMPCSLNVSMMEKAAKRKIKCRRHILFHMIF